LLDDDAQCIQPGGVEFSAGAGMASERPSRLAAFASAAEDGYVPALQHARPCRLELAVTAGIASGGLILLPCQLPATAWAAPSASRARSTTFCSMMMKLNGAASEVLNSSQIAMPGPQETSRWVPRT